MKTGGKRKLGSQDGSISLGNPHLYLFTLEVTPLEVGRTYDELPLHCTLMHRFYSELSVDELSNNVKSLFDKTPPITLAVYEHTRLGPKQVPVSLIELTEALDSLNMQLFDQLNKLEVEYTAPQWVGKGHVFHITDRENEALEIGRDRTSEVIYLIEVVDRKRVIRERFDLDGRVQPSNNV